MAFVIEGDFSNEKVYQQNVGDDREIYLLSAKHIHIDNKLVTLQSNELLQ